MCVCVCVCMCVCVYVCANLVNETKVKVTCKSSERVVGSGIVSPPKGHYSFQKEPTRALPITHLKRVA